VTEPTFTICTVSGKRRYADELDARIVLSRISYRTETSKERRRARKHEREVYLCPDCGGFHLTSGLTREIRKVAS
jgi:hypothetical protein